MDPLELEDHRAAKEALAEIEAESSDILENMPSSEKELLDAYEDHLWSTEDFQ